MPLDKIFHHILFFVVIAGTSSLVTLFSIRYIKALDVPNERSSHLKITPRGGGVAIVFAFLVGIALINLIGDSSPIHTKYFLGFFLSALLISAIAFFDDFKQCSLKTKLAGYLLATVVALLSGIVIDTTHFAYVGAVYWGWWAYPLTVLWLFGLTNTYNFLDGLDGLAVSTAVIAAGFLSFISFQQGSHFIYLASLALAAASLGFLLFNVPPAKIFMGDVGSTFLGLTFAIMAVIAARYDHSHTSLFVVPMLLLHFIFDASFTFFRRLLAGEKVLQPHRTHVYQLLNRMGYSHTKVTTIYTLIAAMQGMVALWAINRVGGERWLVFLPIITLYGVQSIWIVRAAKNRGLL